MIFDSFFQAGFECSSHRRTDGVRLDLVHATLDLLLDDEKGIWHLTNQGAISWHELAREAAAAAKLDSAAIRLDEEAVDGDTSLSSRRGLLLRPLDQALSDFASHSEALHRFG